MAGDLLETFSATASVYLLITSLLLAVYGAVARDATLVEAGFKVVVVLISLEMAISFVDLGRLLLISLAIPLLYLITVENAYASAIAYAALCLLVSVAHRPSPGLGKLRALYYLEKSALYSIPAVLLMLKLEEVLHVVAAIALLPLLLELKSKALRTCTNALQPSLRRLAKHVVGLGTVLEFITKLEKSVGKHLHRFAEAAVDLVNSATNVEKRVEHVVHRVAKAVEALQYRMEHSFILLLFLIGLLTLITITFYIVLVV